MLPHAQACASLIDKWDFAFPEAARLLNEAAYYVSERAIFAEAEPLYQRALAIREKEFGPEHPAVATSLNNLAELYRSQGGTLRPSRSSFRAALPRYGNPTIAYPRMAMKTR